MIFNALKTPTSFMVQQLHRIAIIIVLESYYYWWISSEDALHTTLLNSLHALSHVSHQPQEKGTSLIPLCRWRNWVLERFRLFLVWLHCLKVKVLDSNLEVTWLDIFDTLTKTKWKPQNNATGNQGKTVYFIVVGARVVTEVVSEVGRVWED